MPNRLITLLLSIVCCIASSIAYAGYDRDDPPDQFCIPGGKSGNNLAFGGKPISLYSGMETFAPSTDLTIGSVYPIAITRNFNSQTSYDSPLGYGWAINYDKRLYIYPDYSVTVRRQCGGKTRFTWIGPGFVSSVGDSGTLIQNGDGTYTYRDKYGETEKYDVRGRLVNMSDKNGNSLVFSYTSEAREFLEGLLPFNVDQNGMVIVAYDYHLSKIEEKDAADNLTGKSVEFHYDSSTGRLTDIMDSTGRTVSYTHDSIGNLTAVSGPSGSEAYGYTDASNKHLLTSIDEGQGAYVNTYDSSGKVIKQIHGTGEIQFDYIVPYSKTKMTTLIKDGAGNLLNTQTRTVEFNTNALPVKVTDTYGNITTYVWDANTKWKLGEAYTNIATGATITTAYVYDSAGNILTKTEALDTSVAKTTIYTYDPTFNLVTTETVASVVNPGKAKVTTNTYDPSTGNLLTTTETGLLGDGTPYSYTTTYTHDSVGHVITIDGPRTDVQDIITYSYDPATGYLISMTQPVIGTTQYSNFDSLGNPQTVTDPNGSVTTYTYDSIGRVSSVKAPGDLSPTQYFYVNGGCTSCGGTNKIDHITLPEGNTIWYGYDTLGNLATITDSQNNSINYTYDSAGNKLTEQIKDASGTLQKALSYQYDALNRLSQIINPDTTYTQYTYDSWGNRTSLQTPNMTLTTYAYDVLNRLTSVVQPGSTATGYGYDTNNNLTQVTDPSNHSTTYRYDDKGRVYQVISPDTGTTTYQYDPAGNMIAKTDAKGVTITYVYDSLNRLTNINFPTDTNIVYGYDSCSNGKGRICSMTDASGTTTYEYAPKGQVRKETKTIDSTQYATQYSYDQNGNIKTMTYPSGRVITYNYTNDKAVSVLNNDSNLATNINYKPFGGMNGITYGNGLTGLVLYDNQYRITGITVGAVMNLSYPLYDANGNIKTINDVFDPTKSKSFTYDALDRLSIATSAGIWGSLTWTYDGVGNRQTENSNSYAYFPNSNRLSSANGLSYGYDNNGNTTSEGSRQYIYNQNQRMIQVNSGGITAYYTYNGNGQRVKKVVNAVTTIFHYNQSGQLIAESNSAGTITAEYVYLNGQPLAKIEWSNTYYYHNDHLGTPQKMTDASGTVVWAADYKPFGEATVTVSTITNNLRFPGQYFDAETGNHYNYRRDYNPSLDRYIEADPIGLRGGPNVYSYVWANPIKWIDPIGLEIQMASCHGNKKCVGTARVLQGNPDLIGRQGGFPGVTVAAGSAAVIPSQWGGKSSLRGNTGSISGTAGDTSFNGVTDVIGGQSPIPGTNVRDALQTLNPGDLILELPSASNDLGTVPVTLTIPASLPCPAGTVEQ
jgi:RHS repeat-associated protein